MLVFLLNARIENLPALPTHRLRAARLTKTIQNADDVIQKAMTQAAENKYEHQRPDIER